MPPIAASLSIRIRRLAFTIGCLALVVGISAWNGLIASQQLRQLTDEAALQQSTAVAALLGERLGTHLETDDLAGMERDLAALSGVAGAHYAGLYAPSGRLLAAWHQADLPPWTQAASWPSPLPTPPAAVDGTPSPLPRLHPLAARGGSQARLLLGLTPILHSPLLGPWQLAGLSGLIITLLMIAAGNVLLRPYQRLAHVTREILATGDLTRGDDAWQSTDVGMLAHNVGQIVHQQRSLLSGVFVLMTDVSQVVRRVTQAGRAGGGDGSNSIQHHIESTGHAVDEMLSSLQLLAKDVEGLEHNAEESSASLVEIAASNRDVNHNVHAMAESARKTLTAMERMAKSIGEIASTIEQLSTAVSDTSLSVQRMNSAIEDVQHNSTATARLSEQVSNHAEVGVRALQKTLGGIENIKQSAQSAAQVIANLGDRISEIGAILRVIDEVAAQTKLLSLNAAIIAAQSGEHGRGFSVVADQIKQLAQRTGASTREISTLIGSIQEQSRNATEAMSRGVRHVEVGVQLGAEAALALAQIRGSATESAAMIHKIAQATVEHSRGSKQIATSIERIAATTAQISNYAIEQARGAEQVMASSRSMNLLIEQARHSSDEQSTAFQHVIAAIEGINGMIVRLIRAHKSQSHGANIVQRSMKEIRQVATTQGNSQAALDLALTGLAREAEGLQEQLKQFKHE